MMEEQVVRNTFGKSEKLCQKKAIEHLFNKGKSFGVPFFKVIVLINEVETVCPVKLLIAVPKKYMREANERNRMKRLIRESYRTQKHDLHTLLESEGKSIYLAFIFTGKELAEYAEVNDSIVKAINRIKSQFLSSVL
jgi:ribonuclease P protein component